MHLIATANSPQASEQNNVNTSKTAHDRIKDVI